MRLGFFMTPGLGDPDALTLHWRTMGPAHTRNDTALAGLRIAVGVLFLIFAEYKVFGTAFTLGGGFQGWIHRFVDEGAAYPFMVPMLQGFVLTHGTAIAFLVAYSELAIGIALTLGILTRVASVGGLVYMLTLLVSSNYPGPHAPAWEYFGASLDHLVLALCFATFIASDPDRVLSVRARRTASTGGETSA
jgi:uncharacterized membrane protein YphA (DoxX/SURF4 family)